MVVKNILFHRHSILLLLLLVITANILLYYTTFGVSILSEISNGIVIGSIIDLALVTPLLFITWKQKWTVKNILMTIAAGLILVRFLIPIEYLQPFVAITWVGFMVEGMLVLVEIGLLFIVMKHLPSMIHSVKRSSLPTLFSFSDAVDTQQMRSSTPIIKVFCTEMLIFYYAFASWRKKPITKENAFTLHKKSSLIATYIMLIHSILIETIVIHWALYAKFPIISIVLLILNIYGVIFLLGNVQAIRHNPLQLTEKSIYLSFGVMKRMKINIANIDKLIDDPALLQQKLKKDTIDFIARDLESVSPNVILKLRNPTKAIFLLGVKKEYMYVAIRVDEPTKFKEIITAEIDSRTDDNKLNR